MEEIQSEFLKNRPQRLCHMCGKCCRVVATTKTYQEMLEAAKQGDFGVSEFLRVFEPYSCVEEARKISSSTVNNIIEGLKEDNHFDEASLCFYGCKYVLENNMCSIYETRPELCKRFPSSPWAVVPPGCGFEGWLFMQREEKKQKIRKYKEELISMELELKETQNPETRAKIEEYVQKMNRIIDHYAQYGSKDW